jgi:hypothetical protein
VKLVRDQHELRKLAVYVVLYHRPDPTRQAVIEAGVNAIGGGSEEIMRDLASRAFGC